jgi:soluble lytic murein transglycosylase-like protein
LALVLLVLSGALFSVYGCGGRAEGRAAGVEQRRVKRVEAHAGVLCAAAAESGLDPSLLAGLMYVESRGTCRAVSNKGAMGYSS